MTINQAIQHQLPSFRVSLRQSKSSMPLSYYFTSFKQIQAIGAQEKRCNDGRIPGGLLEIRCIRNTTMNIFGTAAKHGYDVRSTVDLP